MNEQTFVEYFKATGKILAPKAKLVSLSDRSILIAAHIAAQFMSLGYFMQKDVMDRLALCSESDAIDFYNRTMDLLKDQIGANFSNAKIFYPNFPEEVIEKDRFEIFIDQVIYGLSGFEIEPSVYEEKKKTLPFIGEGVANHPLRIVELEDFKKDISNIFNSTIAWSQSQKMLLDSVLTDKDLLGVTKKELNRNNFYKNAKNKENRVFFAFLDYVRNNNTPILHNPEDVLRLAALLPYKNILDLMHSDKTVLDPNTSRAVTEKDMAIAQISKLSELILTNKEEKSFRLNKRERNLIAGLLESQAKGRKEPLSAEFYRKRNEWKALFKSMHIMEKQNKYPLLCAAVTQLRTNEHIDRYTSDIEKAIKDKDIMKAVKIAKTRPGDALRRLDHLLRLCQTKEETEAVLSILDEASKSGISPIIGLYNKIKDRDVADESRLFVFRSKGETVVHSEMYKNREAIDRDTIDQVQKKCLESIEKKFAGKESMGNVYVSNDFKDYTVISDIRDVKEGISCFGRGSKIGLDKDHPIKRLFITWTNTSNERVDLDLSAALYDKNHNFVARISWDKNYGLGEAAVYSGDIQNGGSVNGSGVAEYIDLNIPKLKDLGVKYAVCNVNVYKGKPFAILPNVSFGYMERDDKEFGRHFEPKSVSNRIRLSGMNIQETACMFDIESEKLIWVEIGNNRSYVASVDKVNIEEILEYATTYSNLSLQTILECNLNAGNGHLVEDISKADTIFITEGEMKELRKEHLEIIDSLEDKKIVLPSDKEYITGYLMSDGKGQPERTIEEEIISDDDDLHEVLKDIAAEEAINEKEKVILFGGKNSEKAENKLKKSFKKLVNDKGLNI